MHVPLTLATLALLTAALLGVRLRWTTLSPGTRKAWLGAAVFFIAMSGLSTLSKWETTSVTVNILLEWSRDLGCIFFILLFSLLRPRRISVPIAVILMLPIFFPSIILPLGDIFGRSSLTERDLGHQVQSVVLPFSNLPFNSGADIAVYHRPAHMPLFRHRIFSARFYTTQCDPSRLFAEVVADPKPGRILLHCPAAAGESQDTAHVLIVPLP